MKEPREILKQYFGYDEFRPNQAGIVDAILQGRDVLAVMPTGAGKSVCYQVPALCLDGFTIVVSPLISLMKDQVEGLRQAGIPAAYLNSSQEGWERAAVLEGAKAGDFKLLYVSPERLGTPEFSSFAQENAPALIAIDEAHCISQWGQDFRPSYTRISEFVEGLPTRPIVGAFTATATQRVREDIARSLELRDPYMVVASFDRPNLHFAVEHPNSKDQAVLQICKKHADESGIIYCTARKTVDSVCELLQQAGFRATRYHAGLSAAERQANQEDFVYDRSPIIVATTAFGMGIDKSNVGYVVHYNMPLDLEGYYQEAGRAGRDGQPADCILLYAPRDVKSCEFLVERSIQDAADVDFETRQTLIDRAHERLKMMTFYSTTTDCLRHFILQYFGEDSAPYCGNCSNCEKEFEERDVTIDAQKIISCVYRLRERNREVGKALITDILRGSRSQRILENRFDELSTYGIMAESSTHYIRYVLDSLIGAGVLGLASGKFPVVQFTDASGKFLHEHENFTIKVPKERPKAQPKPRRQDGGRRRSGAALLGDDVDIDGELFETLRNLRAEIASEESVPAYIVFSNATLVDMCRRKPTTEDELLQVSGVGAKKAERYGARFLQAIVEYEG